MTKTTVEIDDKDQLWIELTNGRLPPGLLTEHARLFMIEHGGPGRVLFNVTAYICDLVDKRTR